MTAPEVSIIIVTHNGWKNLTSCLSALRPTLPADAEVIVVDNASTDETAHRLRSDFPWVHVVSLDTNRGLPGGLNAGIRRARGRWLVELNDDTLPRPNWLEPLLTRARENPRLGIAAGKKYNLDGSLQDAGGFFVYWGPNYRRPNPHPDRPGRVDHVSTGFLMSRAMLEEIGLFDESFFPGYFEDLDLCRRALRRGWQIEHVPQSEIVHLGGATARRLLPDEAGWEHHDRNRIRYYLLNAGPCELLGRLIVEGLYLLRLLVRGRVRRLARTIGPLWKERAAIRAGRALRRRGQPLPAASL